MEQIVVSLEGDNPVGKNQEINREENSERSNSRPAIAHDDARRRRELEHLRQMAEKLASVAEPQEVLQQIVESARDVLQADSAVIWSYDAARKVFLPAELTAGGVDLRILEKFRENEPRSEGTAAHVFREGYLAVNNVDNPKYDFLSRPPDHGLRDAIGVKSFQGIALQVEGGPLGVLYVNYKSPQVFGEEDKFTLGKIAYHAALALKKARLLEQVRRSRDAARVIAEVSVLENLQHTLSAIAKGAQDALNCDTVTLFTYDQERDEIGFPPSMIGVNYEEQVLKFDFVGKDSVVHRILMQDNLHVAEDTSSDAIVKSSFFEREAIRSSVGIPLRVGDNKVGVMFVNYRTSHRFTADELVDIELFAHQAAIAIRNDQLYDKATKRTAYLQAFYEAGIAVTSTLALDEILNRIAEQAWRFTGSQGKQARFSYIVLVDGNKMGIKSAYPIKYLPRLQKQIAIIDLERDSPIGITGRTVKTGLPQLVDDVILDKDYAQNDPLTRAELAVPIKIGNEVIGVINVEDPDINAFDEEDQRALETLTVQAAIAIHNARLYEETQHRTVLLATASEVARNATSILDVKQLLDRTVNLISERFGFYHAGIFLLDERKENIVLKAASSKGGHRMFEQGFQQKVGKDGIAGFVAVSNRPYIILDVDNDTHFHNNSYLPDTRSEMALPLSIHGQFIGVLDVQSTIPNAFTHEDGTVLQTLADQLAIAIQNAQQYEELMQTKGMVGARTALAWMGMTSSAWRHTIDRYALNIEEQIDPLRKELGRVLPTNDHPRIDELLSRIRRLAYLIRQKPITPPLSSEEMAQSVPVNDLIRERTKQLWESEPYESIKFDLDLTLDDEATVRASPEWLRNTVDVLINNAVDAMANLPRRQVTIVTRQKEAQVEILVRDTGRGIRDEVKPKLFSEPIRKSKGAKGLGMGLLMAQAIVQTYSGEIRVESTGPTGTTMLICLPLEV
jgi:GAF domain-containing protein